MRDKGCWDEAEPVSLRELRQQAKDGGYTIHVGRLNALMFENHELDKGNPLRKYKGRVVFVGNRVKDQTYEAALFKDFGNSPGTMEASRFADFYGCA